jgi:hypothetical protein
MAKFRPLRRDADPEVQRSELVRHAEQVDRVLPMHGHLVDVDWPFDPNEGSPIYPDRLLIRHSLGRAYRGAFLAGTTGDDGATSPVFVVLHPDQAVLNNVDVTKDFVVVTASTLTRSERARFWVF